MSESHIDYINHFNNKTDQYLLCRPDYPADLFDYLAQLVNSQVTVWDCGTGNGQAAKALAQRFSKVIATDINQNQLDVAVRAPNIEYLCTSAEQTPIQSGTIGLITVAQALHWFNLPAFYLEAQRVSTPNGIIATWCYSLGTFNNSLDEVIKKLYYEILGTEFWPKKRFYIDEHYKTIPFPFETINSPEFKITKNINFSQLMGYLETWSAVKEYQLRQHINPLELVYDQLKSNWGDVNSEYVIEWSLHCLIGKVHLLNSAKL